MKRLNFTSFLFTIAFGLFALNLSVAQSSADCQDQVNFSYGEACNIAVPWEAFTTWAPSCLLIEDKDGNVLAAVRQGSGPDGGTNSFDGKEKCGIVLDSLMYDTIKQTKIVVTSFDGWKIDCDPVDTDTIYVDFGQHPDFDPAELGDSCNRDTLWGLPWILTGQVTNGGWIIKDLADAPPCAHADLKTTADGKLTFLDTISTYTIKTTKKEVWRVDTFSHLMPLQYIKGTIIAGTKVAGGDSLVHKGGAINPKVPKECALPSLDDIFADDIVQGPAKLPATEDDMLHTFKAFTPDSLNFCWGYINVEFKLWPNVPSVIDTLECIELTDYDRSVDYDYHPTSSEKLEDVCEWAEKADKLRTDADIEEIANAAVGHCYEYDITHTDRWIKNFDWICDTVSKERTFNTTVDYSNTTLVVKDTLVILPIKLDSVIWPDSLVVLDCYGVELPDDPKGGLAPESIAEYLYHGWSHDKNGDLVTGATAVGAGSGYTYAEPCSEFAKQYQGFAVGTAGSIANADALWAKLFVYASYNNYGVKQAWPYVKRRVKLEDAGMKAKLAELADSGDATGVGAADYTLDSVYIPINKVVCNIAATYVDLHPISICPGERKFFRQWTVVDWCDGSAKEFLQVIKTVDRKAPEITSIDGKSFSADSDDDNSKGNEDSYFGNNADDDTDSGDVLTDDDPTNDDEAKTHYIKVTNPWGCTAKYVFPVLTTNEYCSTASYKFVFDGTEYDAGDEIDYEWTHEQAPGKVTILLWDDCGNEDEDHYYIDAIDKLPPVVVLHDEIIVTLTSNNEDFTAGGNSEGIAKVYCDDVNAGSHDGGCGTVSCDMRRKGTDDDWEDFVHFDCEDLGENGTSGQVQVEVRITDWSGNTSVGWMTITVENKNGPFITCEDVTVGCNDPIAPEWVGGPHVFGICAAPELEYEDNYQVDDLCYEGYIERTWRVVGTDIQCVQTITIDKTDDPIAGFNPLSIKWPLHNTGENWSEFVTRISDDDEHDTDFNMTDIIIIDENEHGQCEKFQFHGDIKAHRAGGVRAVPYTDFLGDKDEIFEDGTSAERNAFLAGCDMDAQFYCEMGETDEPTWDDPTCGLVGVAYDDETFTFSDGVCFKVLRRWSVIDWCVFEPNEDGSDVPEYDNDNYVLVKDLCDDEAYFKYDYNSDAALYTDGYYTWIQEIKIADDEQPVIVAGDDVTIPVGAGSKTDDGDCSGTGTVTATGSDLCDMSLVTGAVLEWSATVFEVDADHNVIRQLSSSAFDLDADGASASVTLSGDAGEYYQVKWRLTDGCNNPSEFEADGSTAISMIHFVDEKAPVIFCIQDLSTNAMSTDGTTEIWASDYVDAVSDCSGGDIIYGFKAEDGSLVQNLMLDCSALSNGVAGTWEGRVYASDGVNESWCEVTLRISDSNDACPDDNSGASATISGEVRTELGDMIESAQITMKSESDLTSVDGKYAFDNAVMGNSYSLDAKKADDYMNGVSTLDLVLIQKHILGLQQLDSPFKVIAADINSDENVSAIDLVELRKLILGIYSELPNNASWRFADAAQAFDDVFNPFPFVENINIDFLIDNQTNEDFIGIKVGDVSGNAIANSLIAQGRSNGEITLRATDGTFNAGELVRVAISSDEFIDMSAFQFTLNVAGLEFAGVQSGAIAMTEDNIAVHGNALTAAWFDVSARTSSDVLFVLEFRAVSETTLSNSLSIGSSITDARAYTADADQLDIALAFDTGVEGSTFELYQNTPNPFESLTTVGFQLAEAGPATLTVFDVTGKVITILEDSYARGYNEISLQKSDLGASGVLYYQLESGDFTATRKMILID